MDERMSLWVGICILYLMSHQYISAPSGPLVCMCHVEEKRVFERALLKAETSTTEAQSLISEPWWDTHAISATAARGGNTGSSKEMSQ